jgi:RNA 2',3'-cyclic 3'-phosphodiesterase
MRLFVAIELSQAARRALSATQEKLKSQCPDVRWILPEQLHLTVKFLGDVADGDVVTVSEALEQAAVQAKPFIMRTGECGCFPERGAVRIVWTKAVEEHGLLAECVAAVEAQIEPLGFPREHRPFAAHITIGRVREDRSQGKLREIVQANRGKEIDQDVLSLTLMSSALSPKGSTYTAVSRAKLGAC